VAELCATQAQITYEAARNGDIRLSQGDASRMQQVLGIRAETGFRDGLKHTIGDVTAS
jgi:hypothetical protein